MSYIFNVKKEKPSISGEKSHPIFSIKKPIDAGASFEPIKEEEKPKSLTQRMYEQMQESEKTERDIERNISRGLSRMGEKAIGLPGDIVNFVQHITGKKAAEFPLPTSTSLQEKSEKWSQGYTTPQNEFEKKSDEFLGDVAGMMILGGPGRTSGAILARTLGVPLAGNLAQEGVKYATGDEKKAAQAKMGAMFILDLIFARRDITGNRGLTGSPRTYVSELFNEAENSIPQGAMADAINLQNTLTTVRTDLQRGGTSPTTTAALKKIDEALNVINNGQIEVRELPAFRRNINAIAEQMGAWNVELPPNLRRQAINNLGQVRRSIIEAGENYGRTQNPQFLQYWQAANEASSVLNRSNVVSSYIQRNYGNKFVSKGAKLLFGVGAGGAFCTTLKVSPVAAAVTGTAVTASSLIYQSGKVLYRIMESPTLRHYYLDSVTAAMNGQKSVMIQNLAKLDKALEEEEKKEKQLIKKLTED